MQLEHWCATYAAYPSVVEHMRKYWEGYAEHWAWYGRVEVLDLMSNTNNLVERAFGLIKYVDLDRNAQLSLHQLVDKLVHATVPRVMLQRAHQLAGRVVSDQQRQVQRGLRFVESLVEAHAVGSLQAEGPPGLTSVQSADAELRTCLGDLSCECRFSGTLSRRAGPAPPPQPPCAAADTRICAHLKAAAHVHGFTHNMRTATAAHLLTSGMIQVDAATGICICPQLASMGRTVAFRPGENFCSCHDAELSRTCCHLLAARELPEFAAQSLPDLPAVEDAERSKVRGSHAVLLHCHVHTSPLPPPPAVQPLDISCVRTFQQAKVEPLGEGWEAELRTLQVVGASTAAAIRRQQSNANPELAEVRRECAQLQRLYPSLPPEARQQVLEQLKGTRQTAQDAAASAELPRTAARVGKVVRRQQGRSEEHRKTRPLHPSRSNKRGTPLIEEAHLAGDAFQPLGAKGRATNKVRAACAIPGAHGKQALPACHAAEAWCHGAGQR